MNEKTSSAYSSQFHVNLQFQYNVNFFFLLYASFSKIFTIVVSIVPHIVIVVIAFVFIATS